MCTAARAAAVSGLVAVLVFLAACTAKPPGNSPFNGQVSWTQVTSPGPPPRWGHVAVLDTARNRVLVWGGIDNTGVRSDLWALSLSTNTWQQLSAPGGPGGRFTAGAVADPTRNRMILVGGSNFSATNEVWSLDLARLTWSPLPQGPAARYDVGSSTNGTKAWFYGGYSATNAALDDLWELDLATDTWTMRDGGSPRPSPRTNTAFGAIGTSLLLSGGHDEDSTNPDTWRFSLMSGQWTKLTEANEPLARAHYASAPDPACAAVWMFGGDRMNNVDTSELLALVGPSSTAAFWPTTIGPPKMRRHSAVVIEPISRRLVMFGGWQGDTTLLGDTWIAQLPSC
jgi:hypothetical protein